MVCRMCLKDFDDLINIFKEIDGGLNMAEVVGKHFWFEPLEDDPVSTVICKNCWLKVYDFHEFYDMVEKAQSLLIGNFKVKTETENTFFEIGEVPFNMPSEKLDQTDTKILKVTQRDVLSDVSTDDEDDINTDNDNFINECNKIKDLVNKNDSKEVMNANKKRCPKNEFDLFAENEIAPDLMGQKYISSKIDMKNVDKSKEVHINTVAKKRGRPRKCEGLNRSRKTAEQQEAYKAKIEKYDSEIAQYMTLYCDVCNNKSDNFPALKVHMRDIHNIKEGYVTCCDKKFNKRALLLYHIRQHLNPSCYRCEECDFTFSDRQSRHNHFLVKHQKDEDKIYACSQCSKKFVRKYLLEQHKSFSHKDFIPKCKNCAKRFKTADELREHNKEDCYPGTMCDICAKCIRGTSAFKRHQLEHQGIALPKVQCDLCGLWYKDKRGLKRHKRKHVEAKEPHICDICQKNISQP